MLLIFGGLPASGKSTVSIGVAKALGAVHLRIDSIEQAMREAGFELVRDEGYRVAYQIAADNLALGRIVVADSVNPIATTREAWRNVGSKADVPVYEVEVVCSDLVEHKRRFETRTVDIDGLLLPTWNDVVARRYEPWPGNPLQADTAGETPDVTIAKVLAALPS